MTNLATFTLLISGFLVLIGFVQPAAERLRLPYTVLLAVVGIAVGGIASLLLYTPLTDRFNDVVAPIVNLPFSSSVFLGVFLPILLFHAALTIDLREIAADWAPILTLAILAVFAAAGAVGFTLFSLASIPLSAALLVGTIVATTDPAAVVTILREAGAPPRLVRLLEGESLLNDAAAIVLFTVLIGILGGGRPPSLAKAAEDFISAFLGGIVLGAAGGQLLGILLPRLGGSRLAEMTLSVALPYIVYYAGEHFFGVSGVVAVASAGLVAGLLARDRLTPDNWRYLGQVWEQTGFWAGSLVFVTASDLVPKLLGGIHAPDVELVIAALVAAFGSRAALMFGVFPMLSALGLAQRVSGADKLAITWGGLRGAITLALALSVTEDAAIDPGTRTTIAALSTAFVLFTLLVNGLSLRPLIRLLRLDRLSPLDEALRNKVMALSLAEVRERVLAVARDYGIPRDTAAAATGRFERQLESLAAEPDLESAISDTDRVRIGLVALANREHRIILDHHTQHTVSGPAIERLLRNTNLILDAAKSEGRVGYNRAARALLRFSRSFRFAILIQRRFGFDRPLRRQISIRFETLLVRRLALEELQGAAARMKVLGERVAEVLVEVVAARATATNRALDALRLQYPEHAEGLERRFLLRTGSRLLRTRFLDLYEDGLIARELLNDLQRGEPFDGLGTELPALDLGLRTEELIRRFDMFAQLGPAEVKALARLLRPRLLVPDEVVMRRGDRASAMYFISSGAAEVILPHRRVRLGNGDFFGEMALLSGSRRQADVVALGYCRVLVLSAAEFRRFLKRYPQARSEIDRTAAARTRANQEALT